MASDALRDDLDAWIGREGAPRRARDAVNPSMIRHWCDAMGDANPIYTDDDYAAASSHGGIVAPPTMLQAWTMPGLASPEDVAGEPNPMGEVMRRLDAAGYTSVVATNCRQEYRRYLAPGEWLQVTSRVAAVSEEKRTALGRGRFVDQEMVYRDDTGEEVARMTFRILKFAPAEGPAEAPAEGPAGPPGPKPPRPRPATTQDNAFFWEGVDAGELRIQRCSGCERLRHPPGPMCPACQSLEWDAVVASGRGTVFSYVVAHHPAIPPFDYPNAIVLVELEEGVRLVSNLLGVDPEAIRIGMPVRVEFTRVEDDLVLPLFRPTGAPGAPHDG